MDSELIAWNCIQAYHTQQGDSCENCGHGINNVFVVRSSNGTIRKVGSECVNTLCGGKALDSFKRISKRFTKASTQWRKQTPAPKEGETREQYINRRAGEMGNAWNAYKYMAALPRLTLGYNARRNDAQRKIARRWLRTNGVVEPKHAKPREFCTIQESIDWWAKNDQIERYGTMVAMLVRFQEEKHRRQTLDSIARRFGANRFDFQSAPSWKVKAL